MSNRHHDAWLQRLAVEQRALAAVLAAHKRSEKARRDMLDEVERAMTVGVLQMEIADALGVTRVTLWRWLNGHEGSPRAAVTAGGMTAPGVADAAGSG